RSAPRAGAVADRAESVCPGRGQRFFGAPHAGGPGARRHARPRRGNRCRFAGRITDRPWDARAAMGSARDHRPGRGVSETIRVVLAEDHALVREGTAELLERAGGIRVVGQAADGPEAIRLVEALRPDVLLLDLAMPGLDGLEVTRRVRAASA